VKQDSFTHEFVDFIPSELQEGRLYISTSYATAVHLCACGCGNKVVAPISPAEWKVLWDGDTVSLSPSVGNWEFPCQSHYWIRRNRVKWARAWTQKEIDRGRREDAADIDEYFAARPTSPAAIVEDSKRVPPKNRPGRVQRLLRRSLLRRR
jgi:hypothetical protein